MEHQFLNYNLMKSILLVAFLCALTLQQTVLVASGVNTVTIVKPAGMKIAIEAYHQLAVPNRVQGAQWVCQVGPQVLNVGEAFIFESVFYSDCSSAPTILKISGDASFSASLNEGAPVAGYDLLSAYTFTLTGVVCGVNKLRISVPRGSQTPPALSFLVQQDQSQCFKCAGSGFSFYNRNTCQCECIKGCGCASTNSLFKQKDYPVCGCECAQTPKCNDKQYVNQNNCRCQCKPKACLPGFKQDLQNCGCVSVCPPNKAWNAEFNRCACTVDAECQSDYNWNENLCKCEKKCDPICPPHKVWNTQLSKCTCLSIARCAFPYAWNEQTCNCEAKSCTTPPMPDCTPRNCGAMMSWDTKTCACVRFNYNTSPPMVPKPTPPISNWPYPLPPAPNC